MTPETPSPSVTTVGERRDAIAERVAEVMAEGDGHWTACTGCQESVDGCVSTTDYPYDPAFKCQPGGGCGECGGIGVMWTPAGFYDGIIEWSKEQERTRANVVKALDKLVVVNGKIIGKQTAADAILSLESPAQVTGEGVGLREALDRLAKAEETYRQTHDLHGDGHIFTGRAWDVLRRAGNAARDALRSTPTANAPVADVEHKLRMIVSHATGGSSQDIDASVNDICVAITRMRNKVWEGGRESAFREAALPPHSDIEGLEALTRIDQFVTKYREPWGAWKTAWWEDEVSDDAAFTADNALMHVANIARTVLGGL